MVQVDHTFELHPLNRFEQGLDVVADGHFNGRGCGLDLEETEVHVQLEPRIQVQHPTLDQDPAEPTVCGGGLAQRSA